MDGKLTRGPAPRWQKKLDASAVTLNASVNRSKSNSFITAAINKTPGTNARQQNSEGKKRPSEKTPGKKTPNHTPNKGAKTPTYGDRFIPTRSATNFELAHYLIKEQKQNNDNEGDEQKTSRSKTERQKLISDTIQVGDKTNRILCYQNKAQAGPESRSKPLHVVNSVSTKSGSRYIPTNPEMILDAPDIINDYNLNLMDCSNDNVVSIALGRSVYLWNAGTGKTGELVEYEEGHVSAVSWIQEGNMLAIGNNVGSVELWDYVKMKRLRVMDGHNAKVGALAWNAYIVSSGSWDGSIIHHDVRQRDHKVATLTGHTQEVCGLKWSTDRKYLASGGNDNLVNIWPAVPGGVSTQTKPLYVLNQHQAAVRALAWCPFMPNILATGGSTGDRCIKFWNINNGYLINSVDSKSQVCALLWSKTYKEIISAHGSANNQLTIWKYPSMIKQAELTGHTSRVLEIAMSPDGSSVFSAGADETLRLWNCFIPDPKKENASSAKVKQSIFGQTIR